MACLRFTSRLGMLYISKSMRSALSRHVIGICAIYSGIGVLMVEAVYLLGGDKNAAPPDQDTYFPFIVFNMVLSRTDSYLSDMSFASSLSQSDTISGSSTSAVFVSGPGALTGKAVRALGVATLRGFGRLVMARHWATVVHAFPHSDQQAQRIRHIDDIYDDLLEFSRCVTPKYLCR